MKGRAKNTLNSLQSARAHHAQALDNLPQDKSLPGTGVDRIEYINNSAAAVSANRVGARA